MLIDLHTHSSGISRCCRVTAREMLDLAKQIGLDGVALTNHYQKNYVTDGDWLGFAKRYLAEYNAAWEYGERIGLRVLFGIEVTMERYPKVHMLIYGTEQAFLLDNPTLFELSQEELYRLVKQNGGVLIQAHPYRKGKRLLDTRLMDGIEINSHPLYPEGPCLAELAEVASHAGLILTCGGDYHADTFRPTCGTYLPESVGDTQALARYLSTSSSIDLYVQEPLQSQHYPVTYTRKNGISSAFR